MNDKRFDDLVQFHSILDTLEQNIGGAKTRADSLGLDPDALKNPPIAILATNSSVFKLRFAAEFVISCAASFSRTKEVKIDAAVKALHHCEAFQC